MRYHIVTLFPDAFGSYLGESILKRALEDKKIFVRFYNPRDFASGKSGRAVRVDKRPYGGGPGMVIEALPVAKAIDAALKKANHPGRKAGHPSYKQEGKPKVKIIFLCPGGTQFDTAYAKSAAKKYSDIVIVCGRYEGIDARVKRMFRMEEVSVGPFVLTGGELPAMIMMDSISRQLPGVLGDINSLEESRVAAHDVYTRPEVVEHKGKKYRVPKVLLSGNHAKIDEWKQGK